MSNQTRLSGDKYMELLQQRQAEWLAKRPAHNPNYPPLLEWFVRDGDEDLIDPAVLAAPEPAPKRERRPRYYKPASHWRNEIARLEAQQARLSEPLLNDRAAAGGVGLGPKRSARIQNREDGRLRRYVALTPKLEHARRMLRAAEAREARKAASES